MRTSSPPSWVTSFLIPVRAQTKSRRGKRVLQGQTRARPRGVQKRTQSQECTLVQAYKGACTARVQRRAPYRRGTLPLRGPSKGAKVTGTSAFRDTGLEPDNQTRGSQPHGTTTKSGRNGPRNERSTWTSRRRSAWQRRGTRKRIDHRKGARTRSRRQVQAQRQNERWRRWSEAWGQLGPKRRKRRSGT